jgi:hypothetical protein
VPFEFRQLRRCGPRPAWVVRSPIPYSESHVLSSCRDAQTSRSVKRSSADTSGRRKEDSAKVAAAAAESNSASAMNKPSNVPSNTSILKGGTL